MYNNWAYGRNEKLRAVIVIYVFCVGYYSRNICWFPLSIQAGCTALLFLYFGFLIKKIDIKKINVSNEIKMFSYISALIVWIFFVKDFKSFWLVHCDVGRGPVDIFGSLCACYLLYVFSIMPVPFSNIRLKAFSNALSNVF